MQRPANSDATGWSQRFKTQLVIWLMLGLNSLSSIVSHAPGTPRVIVALLFSIAFVLAIVSTGYIFWTFGRSIRSRLSDRERSIIVPIMIVSGSVVAFSVYQALAR